MDIIKTIEDFAKANLNAELAHDFRHVSRVSNWAVKIAQKEGYENLQLVKATALLHDIGLETAEKRSDHGKVGAQMAQEFLLEKGFFTKAQVEEIAQAIRLHCTIEKSDHVLVNILRDADILDLLGAVGIARALISHHHLVDYDEKNIKGETWGKPNSYFTERIRKDLPKAEFITDQINFQKTCFENITTTSAKQLAEPLAKYMSEFILQWEREILSSKK